MESPTMDRAAMAVDDPRIAQLIYDLLALAAHMQDVRKTWAARSGVTGPKWLILLALSTHNGGRGATVGQVSDRMQVNSSFVTTQSKSLEVEGYLTRCHAKTDRRQVVMKLTQKAWDMIAAFHEERVALHREIFGIFDPAEYADMAGLVSRLEKSLRISALEQRKRKRR